MEVYRGRPTASHAICLVIGGAALTASGVMVAFEWLGPSLDARCGGDAMIMHKEKPWI
jgi:hypothetical protein